jgi:hypothetical protein
MTVELTLKNYRCFPDEHPATFRIGDGITALIGPNHAGKSSLLRLFFDFRDLFSRLGPQFWNFFTANQSFMYNGLADQAEVFCNLNKRHLTIEVKPAPSIGLIQSFRLEIPRGSNQARLFIQVAGLDLDPSQCTLAGPQVLRRTANGAQEEVASTQAVVDLWTELSQTTYIPSFRNAINVGTNTAYFDIQTGQSFIQMWQQLKSGPTKAQNEAILKLTEDVRQIFKFPTLEINPAADGTTLQAIISGKSYRLPEIGSGLVQFLLALGSVATRSSAYVLLDEPELNLHPSLQLAFLTTVASYASKGLCFATHSIGLARAGADRVYSVRRLSEGSSELRPLEGTTSLSEFLGELGYLGYREMGFDKILLVEGPNDLKAVQQLLRLYGKDSQIVLLPLGGSSGISSAAEPQLTELFRMSEHIFALIDSERVAENAQLAHDRQAFVEVCKKLKVNCHVLDRRAIENYLPEHAIKSVKGESYRALASFERLGDVNPAWAKGENWRIAREMTLDDLTGTDLGAYLGGL